MTTLDCPHCGTIVTCGCERLCGDDGDIDGSGPCKGLPRMPDPPPVGIVVVRRDGDA
jgi:hypothetical protein